MYEIRKTRPKQLTPFKCFIYETATGGGSGNVIGEFICDKISDFYIFCSDPNVKGIPFPYTGMTDREIIDYLGNGKNGFAWHISELIVYDKPKHLNKYQIPTSYPARTIRRPPQSWCYVEEIE